MVSVPRREATARAFLRMFALVLVVSSCGGETTVGPDEDLAFLVGDWDATRFVVQSKANPEVAPDLIGGLGAQFFMNVQPIRAVHRNARLPGVPHHRDRTARGRRE